MNLKWVSLLNVQFPWKWPHWRGGGVLFPVSKGYQLRISQLNSGVCELEFQKKQEMAENLVFGALPLVLGLSNFPKLV